MLTKYKTILWDFDGVLIDSMPVRDFGFREVLKNFDGEKVEELISYHRKNGGLSRFVKIRYFFEELLRQPVTDRQIDHYATEFSGIMRRALTDKKLLIEDALSYVKSNHHKFHFHIISASAEDELKYLVQVLEIDGYFQSVHGSPTPKTENIRQILQTHNYNTDETCLIGDSKNDWEAAASNGIMFFAYNSADLKITPGVTYIDSFTY